MDKLYHHLLDLDSDEGIRIENHKSGKKIYINRNLLGIYNILVRTKKDKADNINHIAGLAEKIEEKIK